MGRTKPIDGEVEGQLPFLPTPSALTKLVF